MGIIEMVAVVFTLLVTTVGLQLAAEYLAEEQALAELDGINERLDA